jgi:hypothetical protein
VAGEHAAGRLRGLHKALLTGLLGNVGCRIEAEGKAGAAAGEYLGRAASSSSPPGRAPEQAAGPLDGGAELVETTRLYGRGMAHIEPQWLEEVAGHLLKSSCSTRTGRRRPARWSPGARHAVRPGGLQRPARALRPGRPAGARELSSARRWWAVARSGRARCPFCPPTASWWRRSRAGAQVAPPGRAGGRRADLRLLRPAPARRRGGRAHAAAWWRQAQRATPDCCCSRARS